MKIPLLILTPLFAVSLFAQEDGKVDPPAKVAPPAKAIEKAKESAKPTERRRYVPESTKSGPTKTAPATRTPSRRVVLPSKARNSTSSRPAPPMRSTRPPVRPSVVESHSNNLAENMTLQLQGSVVGGPELDLAMTGIGPLFRGDVVAGDDPAIVTHTYTVVTAGDGYKVDYSIGLRLQVEKKSDGRVNVEFHDVVVTGTAMVEEEKTLVISKNGDRELSLTLSKTASK
jgi:hypothetical protein